LTLIEVEVDPGSSDPEIVRAATSIFNSRLGSYLRAADICTGNGRQYRILLPTTDEGGGAVVCERLLSVFSNPVEASDGSTIGFSLNLGVASHSGGGTLSREQMLEQARKALQQSKLKGPNTYAAYSNL
jgi:GGDEF domain-containing protein